MKKLAATLLFAMVATECRGQFYTSRQFVVVHQYDMSRYATQITPGKTRAAKAPAKPAEYVPLLIEPDGCKVTVISVVDPLNVLLETHTGNRILLQGYRADGLVKGQTWKDWGFLTGIDFLQVNAVGMLYGRRTFFMGEGKLVVDEKPKINRGKR